MPCNVCHSKNAETVAFLSLAESDRCTLRQKHSDCAEDWVICELCVRQARPNPFFGSASNRSATSSSTTTAATNAADTATSSATTSATRAVPVKPVKPLRKAKKERTLKTITVDDRVAKYGKYGLYNNNGVLTCRPCGQRLDYTRDDVITTHITRDGHDRKCAAQISHGAQYVLAAGYEEREKLRQHKAAQAKERAEQRRNPSHNTQTWDKEREKKYRAQLTTENRAKREAFREGSDVTLPADSDQTTLPQKDPRTLSDDLVFVFLSNGRSLALMDELRPVFRVHSAVGGHMCGKSQAETYVRPTVIKQERTTALNLLRNDVDDGGGMGLIFDETTDCCDDHPVNIILTTQKRMCYVTTAFIDRKSPVNNITVANAIMNEWPALNLPREKVLLVLVDNAGYCALAFTAHLQAFFPNAKLRTCWGHTGNRFGAAMLEHPDMAELREYLKLMRSLVFFSRSLLWLASTA